MMKKMLVMICISTLSLPLGLTGCNRAKLKNLRDEVAETKQEKDSIEARMYVVTQARDELQQQVQELTKSHNQLVTERGKLQEQVDELTAFRTELQIKNEELTKSLDAATAEVEAARLRIEELIKSRDTAIAEVQTAKLKIDDLAKKLKAETEKVRLLQDQLKQVQATLAELQRSFKM